jgi:hypothetical protein
MRDPSAPATPAHRAPLARRAAGALLAAYSGRAWRRFEAAAAHCVEVNEATLRQILRRQRNTAFGRTHDFDGILAAPDPAAVWRRRVPVSTYADYADSLERMAGGAANVLVADPVVFFAPSSGTTGRPKMIPVTARSLRQTLRILLLSRGVLERLFPGSLGGRRGISLVRMADNRSHTAAGIPTGDASAAGMRRAAALLPLLYTTPTAALQVEDRPSALFVHLLFGLLERDLGHISATFAHYVVHLFRTLEARWADLLESMATGRLPADLLLTGAERTAIEASLRPAPALAAALRPELTLGMDGIARRLWPQLAFVAAATTGPFAAYRPELGRYLGSVPVCNLLYGATEACIGITTSMERPDEYALVPGSCVYEFIPAERADEPSPPTSSLAELEQGGDYEVVITSGSGLYRYRMDDVVRVAGFQRGNPQVEFRYRRGTVLNVAAEKTTEQQVADVVTGLAARWRQDGTLIRDYTVMADTDAHPPRYRFLLELGPVSGAVEAMGHEAARFVDAALAAANVDFRLLREARAIGAPVVEFVVPGSFEALLGRASGSNMVKVPRALRDPEQARFLLSRRVRLPWTGERLPG